MDPARIFTESLTPRPELENKICQLQTWTMSRAVGTTECTGNAVMGGWAYANPSLPVFPADGPKPYNGTRSPVASFRRQCRRTAHD
jgi:hypothetical protein